MHCTENFYIRWTHTRLGHFSVCLSVCLTFCLSSPPRHYALHRALFYKMDTHGLVFPFVCLSVCVAVCLSVCLSICLSVCFMQYWSTSSARKVKNISPKALCTALSTFLQDGHTRFSLRICLSVCLSVCLSARNSKASPIGTMHCTEHFSIRLSHTHGLVCAFVCLSVCLHI